MACEMCLRVCIKGRQGESVLFSPWPRSPQKGDQRGVALLPLFEELQSASVLFANDLWTKEEEWEGSLGDIWKSEGKKDEWDR